MDGGSFTRGAILLISLYLCSCSSASVPLLAWSNTELFATVSSDDLSNTYWLLNQKSGDLSKLDFILVFASGKLDFDDIARYGGLYDDGTESPLAPLQSAMESAGSSVWGKLDGGNSFIDDISFFTYAYPQYLSWPADPNSLKKSPYGVKLVVIELFDSLDRETSLSEHGSVIGHVMKRMDDLDAKYAAFYGAITRRQDREKRSSSYGTPSHIISAFKKETNNNSKQICDATAIIYEQDINETTGIVTTTFCSLLCMRSTERGFYNTTANDTSYEPLLAVYWPSWVDQQKKLNGTDVDEGKYPQNYHCNMTKFEFDETTSHCWNSSLQDDYLSDNDLNLTTSSITAYMMGNCGAANDTDNTTDIILKLEFIFLGGGSDKAKRSGGLVLAPLPHNQLLLPGYWTMQLMVSDVTDGNNSNSSTHFLTRYRTNIDFSKMNGSDAPIVERRGIFYPFSIPFYAAYSCLTHKDRLWLPQGNLNRFVPTKLPFNVSTNGFEPLNISDGPVLQFVGFQVQAFGNVYGAHVNTTFLAFSSVYDCEGYFDIATWMGTFVAVVVIIMFYFATLTLFSMQTVDRFDDPRGRTISVENLH